jgi:hypothetical protein
MALLNDTRDSSTGTTGNDEKHEQMCRMMEQCCAEMSVDDKKKMMEDMMPRMMDMMGGGRGVGMMGTMMKTCMRGFRWFPLIPITVGTALFLLGYFLDADVVRVLFLILAAMTVIMGIFAFFMMRTMMR